MDYITLSQTRLDQSILFPDKIPMSRRKHLSDSQIKYTMDKIEKECVNKQASDSLSFYIIQSTYSELTYVTRNF